MSKRSILTTFKNDSQHWVGDGFLSQTMIPPALAKEVSPFILAGYTKPKHFAATDRPRGVEMHPHRGFETISIVYQGEVEHHDTMGNRGVIGPGEVQWMTAARGVQHAEYHGDAINSAGGVLEMVQMWVNLPASHKMTDPRYQSILVDTIPTVPLGRTSKVKVIAGEYDGVKGPTETVTPLQVWDVFLKAGETQVIDRPEGETLVVAQLTGMLDVNGERVLDDTETAIFTTEAGTVIVTAKEDSHYLVLAGEPIDEPMAMGGPFVMNTEQELRQAFVDFSRGEF